MAYRLRNNVASALVQDCIFGKALSTVSYLELAVIQNEFDRTLSTQGSYASSVVEEFYKASPINFRELQAIDDAEQLLTYLHPGLRRCMIRRCEWVVKQLGLLEDRVPKSIDPQNGRSHVGHQQSWSRFDEQTAMNSRRVRWTTRC